MTVNAMEFTSSASPVNANASCPRPKVYRPADTPECSSSFDWEMYDRGVYTSNASMPTFLPLPRGGDVSAVDCCCLALDESGGSSRLFFLLKLEDRYNIVAPATAPTASVALFIELIVCCNQGYQMW